MSISKFSIVPECNLLLEFYAGSISLPHFFALKQQEAKHPLYSPRLSVITDIRNVDYHIFNKDFILQFVQFIKSNEIFNAQRKLVIITQTPNQVVWAQLYDDFIQEIGVHVKTVTSLASAYSWLQIPIELIPVVETEYTKLSIVDE